MLDILTFIFGSFWRFAGTTLLLAIVANAIANCVQTGVLALATLGARRG